MTLSAALSCMRYSLDLISIINICHEFNAKIQDKYQQMQRNGKYDLNDK